MKLLLDTHVYLWLLLEPEKLSRQAADSIRNEANELFLSVASLWEVAIKASLGKLTLPQEGIRFLLKELSAFRVQVVPVLPEHLIALGEMALHHRDPFDRLILAQAGTEGLTVVSADQNFLPYGVDILSA